MSQKPPKVAILVSMYNERYSIPGYMSNLNRALGYLDPSVQVKTVAGVNGLCMGDDGSCQVLDELRSIGQYPNIDLDVLRIYEAGKVNAQNRMVEHTRGFGPDLMVFSDTKICMLDRTLANLIRDFTEERERA
jgi:cellulose synthase/poly-beta-1,6-N-acetylglucosamine synthase-like glycosyltransferase